MTFKKARTLRRLARRRGWDVQAETQGSGDPVRAANGAFKMKLRFSLDSNPTTNG